MTERSRNRFAIAVTQVDGARVVRLTGEFDLSAVETFEDQLGADRHPDDNPTIFDLRDLRFMDSSGLRALIRTEAGLREGGARVIVVTSSGQVADLLDLTGVAERLETADEIPADLRPESSA